MGLRRGAGYLYSGQLWRRRLPAIFSPDGTLLAYDPSKSGSQQVFVKHGIAGAETAVTDGSEMKELFGWTPDGKEVIYSRQNKDTAWDLYAAAEEGDHKVRPLLVARLTRAMPLCRLMENGWRTFPTNRASGRFLCKR